MHRSITIFSPRGANSHLPCHPAAPLRINRLARLTWERETDRFFVLASAAAAVAVGAAVGVDGGSSASTIVSAGWLRESARRGDRRQGSNHLRDRPFRCQGRRVWVEWTEAGGVEWC